jgi:hypothetical protein
VYSVTLEPSGSVGLLPRPSSVTVSPRTETAMRAVGLSWSRPWKTTGAETAPDPSSSAHRATTSFGPDAIGTKPSNVEPLMVGRLRSGSPFTSSETSGQSVRPATVSLQEKTSPPRVVSSILGSLDDDGAPSGSVQDPAPVRLTTAIAAATRRRTTVWRSSLTYSFIPEREMPRTNCFWKTKKTITTGIKANTDPAITRCHSVLLPCWKIASPSGSVNS